MRWKMRIMSHTTQTGMKKEGKATILKTPQANISPSPLILDLYPVYEYTHTHMCLTCGSHQQKCVCVCKRRERAQLLKVQKRTRV